LPKKAKELTPLEVKRKTKPGLHAVGGVAGLHLQVSQTGARSWILRVKVGEKRRDIGLGGFPDVPLKNARERARQARDEIAQGIDPIEAKKARKAALIAAQAKIKTFEEAAVLCHATKAVEFRNAKHQADWINSLKRYACPAIGSLPVAYITSDHVYDVLEPIWMEKTETATRVRQRMEAVFAWATSSGYREGENPARWKGNLEFRLARPSKIKKTRHFKAIHWSEVAEFMARLRARQGISARALEFAILTAARSSEVRLATWDEIDLDAKLWTVPGKRMKAEKDHAVPLSEQAIRLLKALPVQKDCPYVFPSPRDNHLSDMALSQITRRMGVDAVPHGFRSTFKDWARTSTSYPDEVSELALAHVSTDATRAAYARDALLPKRARMMEDWARFCATTQVKAEVTPIKGKL
jgi:integrase